MRPPHWLKVTQKGTDLTIRMADRWLAIAEPHDPHTVHVIPLDDLTEHDDMGTDCVCGPSLEFVGKAGDGSDAWLVTHHSLDGREQHEQA